MLLERTGAALQFAEAGGEPVGSGSELRQPGIEPLGRFPELADAPFEPAAAGDDAVEAAVDAVGNSPQASHFVALGGEAKAREAGKLRAEGKSYVVKDGDVMHFLHS